MSAPRRTLAAVAVTVLAMFSGLVGPAGGSVALAQEELDTDCRMPPPPGDPLPPDFGRDPMITRLGLPRAWDLSKGAGVIVGVVDSGVDFRHPKLGPATLPGRQVVSVRDSRQQVVQPIEALDCDNHGTFVAGLIAARQTDDERVMGVAPEALIYPVRLVGGIDQAPVPSVAAAIGLAVDGGARVLNLSFAVSVDHAEIRAAIDDAVRRDVVVVAAAGNENQSDAGETWFPAAYDGVLGVAALDSIGAPLDESNSGAFVDIAAPGENLGSTSAGGGGFGGVTGTSYAAALVSGTAALVRSRFPGLNAQQVAAALTESAVPTGDRPERVGAGAVDPFGALTHLPAGAPPAATGDAGTVAVAPVPPVEPTLRPGLGTAAAWTGAAAFLGLLALIGGVVVRRAAKRGWTAGPTPEEGTVSRPASPSSIPLQ